MTERKTKPVESAMKVLDVLNLLLRHFALGLTSSEIAKGTGLSQSDITRYVMTLEEKGFAERIPESGRIRPSVRVAQAAVQIMKALDDAAGRIDELKTRINRTH